MPSVRRVSAHPISSEEYGIENRAQLQSLVYNEAARMLVGHFQNMTDPKRPVSEIYVRTLEEAKYRKVPAGGGVIFERLISAASAPLIFFNELRHHSDVGMDWNGIRCLDLTSGQLTTVVSEDTIAVPEDCRKVWVSSLLSADPDGKRLFCAAGFWPAVGELGTQIDYWLCELPVHAPVPRKLSKLQAAFC